MVLDSGRLLKPDLNRNLRSLGLTYQRAHQADHRTGRRPPRRGFGGDTPFRGGLKNSEIETSSVFANRSSTSTVGFSSWRSSPLV